MTGLRGLIVSTAVAIGALCAPAAAWANYVLKHPAHEHCKAHYTRTTKTVREREDGRTVTIKETICVPPKPTQGAKPPGAGSGLVSPPVGAAVAPANEAPVVPAPTITMSQVDPEGTYVTYTITDPTSVHVTLDAEDGDEICTIETPTTHVCKYSYPHYGPHTVTAVYLSGGGAITEPFTTMVNPLPYVNLPDWGVEAWEAGTDGTTATASEPSKSGIPSEREINGVKALGEEFTQRTVTLMDANFEGATTVTLEHRERHEEVKGKVTYTFTSCEATVVANTSATCTLASSEFVPLGATLEPLYLIGHYPGGVNEVQERPAENGSTWTYTVEWSRPDVFGFEYNPATNVYTAD